MHGLLVDLGLQRFGGNAPKLKYAFLGSYVPLDAIFPDILRIVL